MKVLAAVLVVLLLPVLGRAADDHPALGDTLRAYMPGGPVEGTFVAADAATLTLRREGGDSVLPLDTMTRLDVKTPSSRGRHAGRGALVGGGLGVITGAVAVARGECDGSSGACGYRSAWTLVGASVLGAMGAGLGALIGAALPATHWRSIDTRGMHVSIVPVRRGAQMRLALAF